jgi:hypothetical protein
VETEPTFQQVIEMMAAVHKQNMEMLDKIIALKTMQQPKVNEDEISDSNTTT